MMNNVTIPNWLYLVFMMLILIIAGLAEYIGLAPTNTFYTVFLLVIGLISPSPAFPRTTTRWRAEVKTSQGKQSGRRWFSKPAGYNRMMASDT